MLTIVFVVHSCRKNTLPTQQELNAQAAAHFPIGEARDWFTGNKTALATRIKLNATEEGLSVIADFTPVWDSARTAADTNYYAVEAPAKYLKRIVFSTESSGANANGLTRLLVLKSKRFGSLSAVLMQIHSDGGTDINQVHFMDVPANFSGNIFYTTVQGVFLNGYIFKNGKITKRSSGKATVTKPGGLQVLQYDASNDICEDLEIGWFMTTCWPTGGEWIDCDKLLLYTSTYTYCHSDGDHGGGGGATPPPPDCPNGTHFVDGGCMVNDTVKKKTPCDEVAKVNTIQADANISSQDSIIKNKLTSDPNHEWGADHRIGNISNSNYLAENPTIGPDRSTWNYPTFYWDNNNGHTVGWSHDHPDAGPDCNDLGIGLQMFNQHVIYQPPADQTFYQSNLSVTTITQWGTYIVTVSDWTAFNNIISITYEQVISRMDAKWQDYASEYLNNNNNGNNGDAGAYALMKIFGSSINTFFKAPGQTAYKPITLNTNYGIATTNCP